MEVVRQVQDVLRHVSKPQPPTDTSSAKVCMCWMDGWTDGGWLATTGCCVVVDVVHNA
jgi:hypothetical protein